ncbi:hypothetical protein FKW77_004517 [Venturia effusa]|uniref:Uncharacterized protein n=1 Tax=Venturia effusa TaxID=50376 RepID=A0A517L381_9PEZI|nr:hypothetical protein FKW77_004517 [Venturia effusa]
MDYLNKSAETRKALYTAVDGAIRNPDHFLAHGQHLQQYGQPQYNNAPDHSASYQQQTTAYSQSSSLPTRPQTSGTYPQPEVNHENQQYPPPDAQFASHGPASAPYTQTPHPTDSQPAWQPQEQISSPLQQASPVFYPVQPPAQTTQQALTPIQSSRAYPPPRVGAFSPPLPSAQSYNQISPVQPVSPITSCPIPASQSFSPPPPSSTPGIVSPQASTHSYSFSPDSGQYQGHVTPPPVQNPAFGSHAGLALNPYHAPSAIPSVGPLVSMPWQSAHIPDALTQSSGLASPPLSQSPQSMNSYNQAGSGYHHTAFMAELPEDSFASRPVELPAELPADLLPSEPTEHNRTEDGQAHTETRYELDTGTHMATFGNPADNAHGRFDSPPKQPSSTEVDTPVISPSIVTRIEQVQQLNPLNPQTSSIPVIQTTPPPTRWQDLASSPTAVYNPSTFSPMPSSQYSALFQQTESVPSTSGYTAYSKPQQPASCPQPHNGIQGYVPYGQEQHPIPQAAYSNPAKAPYAPLEQMGSLAQSAQQMSLHSEPSAQFPYRTAGGEDCKDPSQPQPFGLQTENTQQDHTQQPELNVNAPGYHPHGPPPPYM